jgi:aminoglycoside phosphotransferase (APT) family kinase protein
VNRSGGTRHVRQPRKTNDRGDCRVTGDATGTSAGSSADTVSNTHPGLDLTALSDWWTTELAEPPEGEVEVAIIAGGKSNLTYRVSDADRAWVLRRPPLGHVLATAHDMHREYRVMKALAPTEVPVPRMLGLCQDISVIGAPFYVMTHVEGVPYRSAEQLHPLGGVRTRRIAEGMVDTLATLHEVDPAAIGLGDFGRPDGFLDRQVRRWKKQLDGSHTRDLPAADELYRRLMHSVESAERVGAKTAGIVHGDYKLDNILMTVDPSDSDRPAAVIDWEMATLGDTLTDVALLVVYNRLARFVPEIISDVSLAAGFLDEEDILARYAGARGRDLAELEFHLALASFKLVAILEGIHYRYLQGQTVGGGFDRIGEAAEPLLELSLDAFTDRPR